MMDHTAECRIFWMLLRGEKPAVAIPWASIIERARREGVLPYLAALHEDLPNRAEMRKAAVAAHLSAANLARRVAVALESATLEWAILKGFAAASLLYDDPSARPSGDCDVIVRAADRAVAAAALERHGFAPTAHHRELFVGDAGEVDLHVSFVNAERVTSRKHVEARSEDWVGRVRRIETEAGALPVLGAEDLAAFLALHLIHHHGCVGARWIVDIHKLVSSDESSVPVIRALGPNGELLLRVVGELMGSTAAAGAPTFFDRMVVTAAREGMEVPGLRFLLSLRDIDSWAGACSFVAESVFPRGDVMRSAAYAQRKSPLLFHMERLLKTSRGLCKLFLQTIGGKQS